MKVNFVLFQDKSFEVRKITVDVDSFTYISHLNISRPNVTFKQLPNYVFLFMIYAPQSSAPLPKLRLKQGHMCKFLQPSGTSSVLVVLCKLLVCTGLPAESEEICVCVAVECRWMHMDRESGKGRGRGGESMRHLGKRRRHGLGGW